jgi:hypothetical protein
MNFKKLISWAMVASVFMDDFIFLRHKLPFDFYYYYLIFAISIIYYIKSSGSIKLIPRWFIASISLIIFSTLVVTLIEDSYTLSVTKQIIGLLFTSIAYYTFLSYNDFEVRRIFKMYVYLATFVALEGLLEEVLNIAGIHINDKMKLTSAGFYRIYGIMGEPYFLASSLIPAMYFAFYKTTIFEKILSNYKNLTLLTIITTCFIFTFSSASFLGIGAIFFFWLYNKKYLSFTSWKIILLPFLVIALSIGFANIQKSWAEFNIKYTQTLTAFSNNNTTKKEVTVLNSSSFALYSNYVIAKHSFESWPLTGTGIGTHETNYKKYFSLFFDKDFLIRYGAFNMADANSLFIRLLSETGLLGLALFFTFMFKFLLLKKGYDYNDLRDYLLINQAIFILFIVRLIRTGNYFGNGFFLFFFIYYLSYKIVSKRIAEKRNEKKKMIMQQMVK